MKARKILARVAVVLVATVAAACAVEVFLASVRPVDYRRPEPRRPADAWRELLHRRSSVPGLGYELAPGRRKLAHGTMIRTNSLGLRDDEEPATRTAGLLRVAAVGDSFTFGWGVEAEQAYPEVLERMLSAEIAPRPCEVLNFGVGGYSTVDEAVVVERKALPLDPDVIVLQYFLNDPETDPIQPLQAYFAPTRWWQRLNLTRLVAQVLRDRRVRALGGGDYYRYLHASGQQKWAAVEGAFDRIHAAGAARGVPVLLVIFPESRFRSWEEYRYRDLHLQVATAARAAGLDVLDLLDAYSRYPPLRLCLGTGDHHPSPLGHVVAAGAILDALHAHYPQLFSAQRSPRARLRVPGGAPGGQRAAPSGNR